MYFPSRPLSLPKPTGKRDETEFSKMRLVFSVEAFTKMTFAKYSVVLLVSASMTRTPVAFPFFSSYMIECTMAFGCRVRLPVFAAQGSVEELLLKYPPKGQPR